MRAIVPAAQIDRDITGFGPADRSIQACLTREPKLVFVTSVPGSF
jgi:hypothetical protein